MSQKTITINGTVYDAHTGLPINNASPQEPSATSPVANPSQVMHHRTQKSQTLTRRHVQKSQTVALPPSKQAVQKSPMVTKFAPRAATPPQNTVNTVRPIADIGPVSHPLVARVHKQQQIAQPSVQKAAPKPSHIIKQEAIAEAMQKAPAHNRPEKVKNKGRFRKFASAGSVALALLLLAGYFTYLNMPNLSVRVAAAQAGVNATYPEYRPDGYSLSGSVAYNQGWVSMKFASNSGTQNFTVKQSKSSWDSSALLDNHVKDKAGDNYIPYNERGLTIYIYNSNAAWVNDGILYTIEGDAPLSSDQIRRIATSM